MLDAVAHAYRNLLPRFEAEVSQFQQRLVIRLRHRTDDHPHFPLEINEPVYLLDKTVQIEPFDLRKCFSGFFRL